MTEKSIEEIHNALSVPFPPHAIKKRQGGGGKMLDYVETHTVIRRLNEATNFNWDFHIKSSEWRNDLLMVLGELTIPGMGTRSGYGVQKVNERGGEDLVKGAASDALKKCATLFGVALDLYGPDLEAGEVDTPAPRQQQRPQPTPISQQPRRPDRLNPQVNNPYTGPEIDIDESIKQDFLDAIASARTREEWTELLEAANSNEEPGIREAFWMILVSNAPTFAILKNIIGGAETRNAITRRVAEAARYRSIDAA